MAFIVRMAEEKDLKDIYNLSKSVELFNLPPDKDFLQEIILISKKSIASTPIPKIKSQYLFVLEDTKTKVVIGTGQIKAQKTHDKRANYTFQILQEKKYSHSLDIFVDHKKLKLTEDWEPLTELGGLVVAKDYQGSPNKLGKLLSFARLFYISQFVERFNQRLYVEIAPKSQALWKSLSSKFIPLTYKEADLKSKQNQEFFSSLLPKEDIYLSMLSEQAQKDIAQAPDKSLPAMKLLEKTGFVYRDEVDPFDGGICLRGRVQHLPFYKKLCKTTVHSMDNLQSISKPLEDTDKYFLLSNGDTENFKCALVKPLKICHYDSDIQICCEQEILDSLKIKSGESVTSFVL
ncbi:MAG: arginine N-succinyltransferase [Bdellovibrionales bacterium]|nr:arginine N-succinyltransferase [Bdellovibrionales bacterium]